MPRFVPNSSKKIRRCASVCCACCWKLSRFACTSGRSCSLARSVFFPRQACPGDGTLQGGTADLHLVALGEPLPQLVEGLIVLLLEQTAHVLHTRGVDLRGGSSTMRTRCDAAGGALQVEVVLHRVGDDDEPRGQ